MLLDGILYRNNRDGPELSVENPGPSLIIIAFYMACYCTVVEGEMSPFLPLIANISLAAVNAQSPEQ